MQNMTAPPGVRSEMPSGKYEPGRRKNSSGFFNWWFVLTAPPEDPNAVSTAAQESVRKSRLLSVIVFSLLIIFVTFIPACMMLPNPYVLVADIGMIVICVFALILNRIGWTTLAGLFLVLSFEAALVMVILTTMPLDGPSIQQYELFVFGVLLAVSLLNAKSVFVVAFFNILFITGSLLYQPKTEALLLDLSTQFWPMLVRPVAVQFLVAGVTYLWVSSAMEYLRRAAKAEREAIVARRAAEQQKEREEQEKIQLQMSIERVVHNHATVMNQRVTTKIPLGEYEPVLWPLINVFNSLQNRLQHARQTETELQQLKHAIALCAELIDQGQFAAQQPLQTKTSLDMLLVALREQQPLPPARYASFSQPFSQNMSQSHGEHFE